MSTALAVCRKQILRSLSLMVPVLLLLAASIYIVYISTGKRGTGSDLGLLNNVLGLGLIAFICFGFMAYEFQSLRVRYHEEEILRHTGRSDRALTAACGLLLLAILILWTACLGGLLTFLCMGSIQEIPAFAGHIFASLTMYCLGPGLVGILAGLSLKPFARPVSYLILAFSSLLISPVLMNIYSGLTIAGLPAARLLDWFAIRTPNADWVPDGVYGIGMELPRKMLLLFWICLLLLILYRTQFYRRKGIVHKLIAILLAAACILTGMRFSMRGEDSMVIKDRRIDNSYADLYYYSADSADPAVLSEADFSVSAYDLQIRITSSMRVTAALSVTDPDKDVYRFTLYHGFEVSSVTDIQGAPVDYERSGDFLDITGNGSQGYQVRYQGNAGKYFANDQAAALPGYIPYYPVPGHQSIWDQEHLSFVTSLETCRAHYKVTVDSPLDICSNLPETGSNAFEGEAGLVSLYGGMLAVREEGGLAYYVSPLDEQGISRGGAFTADELESAWDKLAGQIGLDEELSFRGRKIFMQPISVMGSLSSQESLAIYDDHVILGEIRATTDQVCADHLSGKIPDREDQALLRDVFLECLQGFSGESGVKPSLTDMDLLLRYGSESEIKDPEELDRYVEEAQIVFRDLYAYQIGALGEETVNREVYRYLTAPEHDTDQVTFLYELGER